MRNRNYYYFRTALHLILLMFQLLFWNFTIDDAFISFRYAKNIFLNQEIVFNIGEAPVEGYSNFLWVMWMTLSFVFNIEIAFFSKVSGLIFCHLSVLILYKLAFRISKSKNLSYIVILFYVLTPNIALWSVGGLETSLFSFLLLVSVYVFILDISVRKNRIIKLSPLSFALLSLTRHEGAVLFALTLIFFTYLLFKSNEMNINRRILLLFCYGGTFILTYAPYFLWRIVYYSNILPHTFIAKQTGFNLLLFLERLIFYLPLIIFLIPSFFLILFYYVKHPHYRIKNENQRYIILIILSLSIITLFLTSWMPGYRFTVPIIPLVYLLLPKPLNFLLTTYGNKYQLNLLSKNFKFITITIICIFNFSQIFMFYPFVNLYGAGIKECNIVLGKWINENSSENASLAVWDAGAIPFYSNIRTIDIYPDSLQDLHLFNNPEDADYILNQNITFLILNDEYFTYIKTDIRFLNNYHLIFYAQVYYADVFYGQDYIYQIYLYNDFNISESAINTLVNSSDRFYI
ncbi:MAG: hypothetical protein KGD74_09665 [Candidatus Lokiarchaeota archaeon]|nr:hypothetical protein [Candidatus Lokiarchaeota archaeon]